ncbi:aldo/keto reductase [Rhizobium sp. L1K21]|uniref:aldo/keto reductase n=1 Tax=Rhizobium sp. L1K21 TaxID=2954933 RepID=UPI0020939DD0|nr:aldo/keto reductase [Rhizobium sp. L1K21]MCO6186528.1 aldo/keto reductase [Rhizobium sp. L1K21]
MKYNELGTTGIKVSEICLGTMTWGSQNSEAEAHEQMDYALEKGVNFWDTAELYPTTPNAAETQGRTEEYIGSWFKKTGKRNDVVLATKISGRGRDYIRGGVPISAEEVDKALDLSLKRLGVDHVDLYQLHWPNRGSYAFRSNWAYDASTQDTEKEIADLHSILEALGRHVKAGKIRAIGVSNDTSWGVMKMLELAKEHGLPRLQSIQNEYNLLDRKFDTDLAEIAHHTKVGLLAYTPLAAGLLTGKYQDGSVPAGSRMSINTDLGGRIAKDYWKEPVAAYLDIAKRHDLLPEQMALAFCASRYFMTSVIIGATSMEQLKRNIGAADVTLSSAVLDEINAVHRKYPLPI